MMGQGARDDRKRSIRAPSLLGVSCKLLMFRTNLSGFALLTDMPACESIDSWLQHGARNEKRSTAALPTQTSPPPKEKHHDDEPDAGLSAVAVPPRGSALHLPDLPRRAHGAPPCSPTP